MNIPPLCIRLAHFNAHFRRLRSLACVVALAGISLPLSAQAQGGEDSERKPAEAQRAALSSAPTGGTGLVILDVDVDCELRVNGERYRTLRAGAAVTLPMPAGEQQIECVSAVAPGLKAQKVLQVDKGGATALTLTLGRFHQVSASLVLDIQQGLQWTRSDNGKEVRWAEAQSYCQGLGRDWRLPTAGQLLSLFDPKLPGVRCGSFPCKVPDQFQLSTWWFWSSDQAQSARLFWVVDLTDGRRRPTPVSDRLYRKALCVRNP